VTQVDHSQRTVLATVAFVGAGAEGALAQIAARYGRQEALRSSRALTVEVEPPLGNLRGYLLVTRVVAVDDLLEVSPPERADLLRNVDGLACFGDRDRLLLKAACDEALEEDVPALLVPPGETATAVIKGMGHAIADRVKDELPDEPPDVEPPDEPGPTRLFELAGYTFLLPEFWGEPTRMAHEHLQGFDSYGTHDFGLLVRIAPGAGSEGAVDEYLAATHERWAAETRVASQAALADNPFRGESAYGCEDAHSVETLVGCVGPDLIAFHMVYLAKNPRHAQLRRLVLTMIESAIVKRWS
jgi:hypothetical protein